MISKYLPYWTREEQATNQKKVSIIPKSVNVPKFSKPQNVKTNHIVGTDFLEHHIGLNHKFTQYLYNRGLINSGFTKKTHSPVIVFNVRNYLNAKQANSISHSDLRAKNSFKHDLWLSSGRVSKVGQQEAPLTGLIYLYLKPQHYVININHEKYPLLTVNRKIGFNGYKQYQNGANHGFNFRIGTHRHKLIATDTPLNLLSYVQLHLKKHNQIQNTMFLSTFNHNRNIYQYLGNQHMQSRDLNKIVLLPTSMVNSQKQVQCLAQPLSKKIQHQIKVQYPINYRMSWTKMLQNHTFRNKYYVLMNRTYTFHANQQKQTTHLVKQLGDVGAEKFDTMIVANAMEFQNSLHNNRFSLTKENPRMKLLKISKKSFSHHDNLVIKHYMQSIGFNMSPITLTQQVHHAYRKVYKHPNKLLHDKSVKFLLSMPYKKSIPIKHIRRKRRKLRKRVHQIVHSDKPKHLQTHAKPKAPTIKAYQPLKLHHTHKHKDFRFYQGGFAR